MVHRTRVVVLFMLTGVIAVPGTAVGQQPELAGDWLVTLTALDVTEYQRWSITSVAGSQLRGRSGEQTLSGSVADGRVTLTLSREDGGNARRFDGAVIDGGMRGDVRWRLGLLWQWRAVRIPMGPPVPVTHTLLLDRVEPLLTSSTEPAIRIFPKDTLRTSTVNVVDKTDGSSQERRSIFASLTGPVVVEGAIPGDTLVIRLTKLTPGTSEGFSGSMIDPSAVTPYHFAEAIQAGPQQVRWQLDVTTGTAVLAEPTAALRGLTIPLRPMLGMIGVAPDGDRAVDPNSLGEWGGNWDYNRVVEGTTVYLPVMHPGAFLYFGDGHAAQGDGEIVRSGIEVSLDVEMTIDLLRDHRIPSPRLETADDLIAIGVHNGLEGALQEATSSLVQWLRQDYRLTEREVAIVLGQAIQYDVASVFARNRVVGARISKQLLEARSRDRSDALALDPSR